TFGADASFTTSFAPPTVITHDATAITPTSATLHGEVGPNNSHTTYRFEWGTDTMYGSSLPVSGPVDAGSGSGSVQVAQPLTGLAPQSTIHFRIVASNGGGTSFGADHSFTTPLPPPQPPAITMTGGLTATHGVKFSGTVATITTEADGAPTATIAW